MVLNISEPSFVHEYDETGEGHTYKGSFARHIAVERLFLPLANWLADYDGTRWEPPLFFIVNLILGLNCNFPPGDVMKYCLWLSGWVEKGSED